MYFDQEVTFRVHILYAEAKTAFEDLVPHVHALGEVTTYNLCLITYKTERQKGRRM